MRGTTNNTPKAPTTAKKACAKDYEAIIKDLRAQLYDANLTIQALEEGASALLINEIQSSEGSLNVYGEEIFKYIKGCVAYIFYDKEMYRNVLNGAKRIAQERMDRQQSEMESDCQYELNLLNDENTN